MEAIPNSLLHELRCNSGVNTALREVVSLVQLRFLTMAPYADSSDDLGLRTDKFTDASNFLLTEAAHAPVLSRYRKLVK